MQLTLTQRTGTGRLILIFAGWGMDANPFRSLRHTDYDIAIAYDYRTTDCSDFATLSAYDEILLIAWSFGVAAANRFLRANPSLPITARIAVNGTLHPVDDNLGIPTAIFEGTLNTLSAATLTKFRRRMCGSSDRFAAFAQYQPERDDITELADELRAVRALPPALPDDHTLWDTIYISTADRIIPTANQQLAWTKHPHVITIDEPHLPDFDTLISRSVINKSLVANRFHKSYETYDSSARPQHTIAQHLASLVMPRLSDLKRPADILEIGCGTGTLTRLIAEATPGAHLTLYDITPIAADLPGTHLCCDAETHIRHLAPQSLDLIISASTIQWFNSPATFIRQCHKALRPDGTLAISTFGPDNFAELRPFLPSNLAYHNTTAWTTMLQTAGYETITIADDRLTLHFPTPAHLLRHISLTGVNALTPRTATSATRHLLTNGPTSLTYHPIYIVARPV